MSIKLIAIDIDGTLLNSHHHLTDEVKSALKQAEEKGVKIVLCTGRPLTGVQDLITELELFSDNDYVVTYNGSLIQKPKTKEIVSKFELTYEDYLAIDTLARQLNIHLHTETEDTMFTSNRDISRYTVLESYLVDMPLKYRTQEEMTEELNILKMMMVGDPTELDAAIEKIPAEFYEKYTIVKSTPYFLEFLNKKVDKGAAVKRLAEHLGLDASQVMALGDNENDLPMIEYAGLGIAMENATDNIKKAASFVTTSNDEHGVAIAIQKFVLDA
ncbi:sugar-phosphatase [Enterococcus sp. LJL98]